jgi:hypothetical protein
MADFGIAETIAIVGLVASGAAAGEQHHQAQQAADKSQAAQKTQTTNAGILSKQLADQTAQNDATAAARTSRLRQRALIGSMQGNDQTISTTPLGLANGATADAGGLKQNLGQ